ncbi:MAG: adenylate/guanylate cyclase domain-containing protein, partial [bacterium]|nr:adenylate/guanylate cyclase domain-containing protein [bacterium]
VAAVAVVQGVVVVFQYITQERQKRAIRRAFQFYLHPALVDQVTENPALLRLGGEEKELTVLFSDIRSFSRISESMSAEALVGLLNEYHTAMTRIVLAENGLLDKYIGDAIMAIFGAPLPLPGHALHACRCALRMMEKLQELQAGWKARGIPDIDIGIGISTALMVAGNMGSELRFDYTVMGDGVNLGSRLEGANKLYGTHILISETTWESVRDEVAAREIDLVRVVGKREPTRIFEVYGLLADSPARDAAREEFEAGLRAYRERRWGEAAPSFRRALDARSDDKCSRLYLERCEVFQTDPPPPEWDGVFEMASK